MIWSLSEVVYAFISFMFDGSLAGCCESILQSSGVSVTHPLQSVSLMQLNDRIEDTLMFLWPTGFS